MRQSGEESQEGASREFSPRTVEFIQRLYRDPRYLLVGKTERFGRELISFVEGCTVISATGEIRGQTLLNGEYEFRGRPDGERPYGQTSLADHFLSPADEARLPLSEEDVALLREESWQYYVRRNFAFLLEEYSQARDDAEHNLSIWNLVEQADVSEEAKWTYLRWWPWIERDRAIAQALWCLRHEEAHAAATELYRAQQSIEQYGERRASFYARERDEGGSLCEQMSQHVASLAEILREDDGLPTSYEEQLDRATARADQQEVERLRREMIQRAVSKDD